jgi:alkanesulfonate monooxygenase SsuD/methylene tetrahydromethanopterin reductase-like flavin-dependent oxidoreductase (luciferase family)
MGSIRSPLTSTSSPMSRVGWDCTADVQLVVNTTSGDVDPLALAAAVEAGGFDGISCSDHLFRTQAYPHVWVTLAAMATATQRISIGSAFANNLFRSPVEFAQASLSMQQLSGGRFQAGLGAGWLEREVVGAGLEFPDPARRARRYKEAVTIVRELFTQGSCTFAGEFYDIDCPAVPVVAAPPPLAVSVGGPWTIRNVAPMADRVELKFGGSTRGGDLDIAELAASGRDDLRAMIDQVREVAPSVPIGVFAMIAIGDGPEVDRVRTMLGDGLYSQFVGEPARVLDNLRSLAELGIDRVQLTDLVKGSSLRLAPL